MSKKKARQTQQQPQPSSERQDGAPAEHRCARSSTANHQPHSQPPVRSRWTGWVPIFLSLLALVVSGYQAYVATSARTAGLRAYVNLNRASLDCPRCDHPETLTPENIVPKTPPMHGGQFPGASFQLIFQNEGQTPAYDIDTNVTIKILDDVQSPDEIGYVPPELPEDFSFRESPDGNSSAHPVINKDAPLIRTGPLSPFVVLSIEGIPSPIPQANSQPGKRQALFLYGHVNYTDVFHIRRHTLFCIRVDGPSQWNKAINWSYCSRHNEQD